MNNNSRFSSKRPRIGRLLFFLALLFLLLGTWRASSSRLAVWSHSVRHGEWTDLAALSQTPVIAGLYDDRVLIGVPPECSETTFPRPLRLLPDGRDGLFVVGLLTNRIGRIRVDGQVRPDTELPVNCFLTGILAERDGVWLTGYFSERIADGPKKTIYMPEYGRYRWFVLHEPLNLPTGRLLLPADRWVYDNETWHDESGGTWFLLSTERELLVVNDQAESATCLRKATGEILWRAETPPRPNGALLWNDNLIVASAQAGVLDFFDLRDGARQRRVEIGQGIADPVLFGGEIVVADWRTDRVLGVDPATGRVRKIRTLKAGPHLLETVDDELWIGLPTINRVLRLDKNFQEIGRWNWSDQEQP